MADSPKKINVNMTTELAKGQYTNTINFNLNDTEAIFDFAFVFPDGEGGTKGEVVSRVITTPAFAQKIAEVVLKTIELRSKKATKIKCN